MFFCSLTNSLIESIINNIPIIAPIILPDININAPVTIPMINDVFLLLIKTRSKIAATTARIENTLKTL